jgi:hypothetical protein
VFIDIISIEDPILVTIRPFHDLIFSKSSFDTTLFALRKTYVVNPTVRFSFDKTIYELGYLFVGVEQAKYILEKKMKAFNGSKIVNDNWLLMQHFLTINKADDDNYFERFYPEMPLYKYKKFILILITKDFFGRSSEPKLPQDKPNIYYKCVIPFE